MRVKIKRLHVNAVIPTYIHSNDAGLDLTAVYVIKNEQYIEYGTGIALKIPVGYVGLLFPRSSVSNYNLALANAVGIVDAGFFGEIKLRFKRSGELMEYYNVGDRIGQLIIIPFPKIVFEEVKELGNSERGKNGFGSSNG